MKRKNMEPYTDLGNNESGMDSDITEDGAGWAALPWVPLLEAFALLDSPALLANAGLVCRAWHAAATDNHLWRRLCFRDWRIRRPLGASQGNGGEAPANFQALYAGMVREHGEYRVLFPRVSDMWEAYEQWLAAHSPQLTLSPGASLEDVVQLEATLGATLPLDMKCSLRIRNGQRTDYESPGLLGGYSFYDHRVDVQLLGVKEMHAFAQSIQRHLQSNSRFPLWLAKACPVARSKTLEKILFVLLEDQEGYGHRGNVVATSEDFEDTFVLGQTYTSFLSDHLEKLLQGAYRVRNRRIELFPLPGARGVGVATTHGITVEAAPLFVTEKSILSSTPPSYFWAYQIRMYMPADCSARPSQLKSRHWVITTGDGQVQEVRGRGVIGLYPTMEPGAYFEYESCCPQPTSRGTMRGTFTMEYKDATHEEFDVIVPEFEFFLPPGSRTEAS